MNRKVYKENNSEGSAKRKSLSGARKPNFKEGQSRHCFKVERKWRVGQKTWAREAWTVLAGFEKVLAGTLTTDIKRTSLWHTIESSSGP